jgi:6,7-dimethyl-8-ribityllumazine synthase
MSNSSSTGPSSTGPIHALIVEAPYYREISDELAAGVIETLEAAGATYERIEVPGAFEIPAAISLAAKASEGGTTRFDCYLALGCVIRGETSHYDHICCETARGLMELSIQRDLAIGFGILTVENKQQALARARRSEKNKGRDVAAAALAIVELKDRFGLRQL